MKIVVGILAGALAAAAATYAVLQPAAQRRVATAQTELQSQFAAERQQWEADLAAARRGSVTATAIAAVPSTSSGDGPTAAELIQKLANTRVPMGPQRIRTQRSIVYDLGRIASMADKAVPDVRAYLTSFEDVEYGSDLTGMPAAAGGDADPLAQVLPTAPGGGGPPWANMAREFMGQRRDNAPLDFPFPPTLRLGLIDALHQMGTPDALSALVEVLQSTGRGLEIAYIARILEEVSPGNYQATAIGAAHELLLNPLSTDGATGVDALQQAYLYKVLEMFKDPTFADAARSMLVAGDGRLNRNAYDYLVRTLGSAALPTLHQAFNNPALTNFMDRASIMNTAVAYVGQDAYANDMFTSVITSTDLPGRMREMTLMSLTRAGGGGGGGFGGMWGGGSPLEPEIAQQRLDYVTQLQQSIRDEDLSRGFDRVIRDLNRQLEGPDASPVPPQGGRGGQGRGGRGR